MDRNSESESATNEDSSDTNIGTMSNHIDSGVKTAGKQPTNNSFATNGAQNGLDRNSPVADIAAKQKNATPSSAKKNNNKKARHR